MSRTAIVTGASRGIGRAIAVRLAKDGINVVISFKGNEEAANEVVKLCEAEGVRALAVKADASVPEEAKALVKAAREFSDEKSVDILVNNAGITRDGLLMKMKDDDFDAVLKTNLYGTFYMMREVSLLMLKKGGRIINISSVSGVLGNPGQANYSASKAGVIGLTKSAAREYAAKKVTVNAVAPGFIETDMTKAMDEKTIEAGVEGVPMKRIGKPEEIAAAVAFLASEESGYITGQVLCVDGGMAI